MQITVRSLLTYGWETFKKRPVFFAIVFFVASLFSGGFQAQFESPDVQLSAGFASVFVLLIIVSAVIQTLITMGKTRLLLKAERDALSPTLYDLWAPRPFWKFFFTRLVTGIIVGFGLILLIVPGIVWLLQYLFAPYLVMEKELSPFDALRESARITYGHKWELLRLGLAVIGLNILGLLFLIVGLLVSIPVTSLMLVRAYRDLERAAGTPTSAA